jgi:hypothetical protein
VTDPGAWVAPVERVIHLVTPADLGEPEDDPFFTVIWFDPGLTTGWAVVGVWPEAMSPSGPKILPNIAAWSAGEFVGSSTDIVDAMAELVEAWGDSAAVGYEDFILRPQRFTMGRELLAPVWVSARFEDRMYTLGRSAQLVKPQAPALAMSTVTDDRLRAWGFWNPLRGAPHARDAVRHAVTYLRRYKDRPA